MTAMPEPDHLARTGLRLEQRGPVATISLDRPARRNAQTPAMWRALAAIGDALPPQVRVVLVRGEGPTFSAGLDKELHPEAAAGRSGDQESVADLADSDDEAMARTIGEYQRGFTFLRDPRFVSIAAVQGHAVGAGFQLALACDLRVAAADASFSMKESALGLVPDLAGTKPLVEAVGYARALEICLTARAVPADEALALGLVQAVVPVEELEPRVAGLAAVLCAASPGVVAETKALLLAASERDLVEQSRFEREAQVRRLRALADPDAPEQPADHAR